MNDKELLKALGLTKKSCISEQIVQTTHHWLEACDKIADLEEENAELKTKKIPQLERKIASIRGSHSVDAKKLNARIEQVERLKKENAELKEVHESDKRSLRLIAEKGAKLELKIKKLTQHLEPQAMTALFEQVEEEVNQEQKIKELEAYNEKLLNGDIEKHNKIVDLEKENAELKEKYLRMTDEGTSWAHLKSLEKKIENLQKYLDTQNSYRECAETWVKLTKAKEIIRQLCSMVRELNKPNVQLTNVDYSLSEAEQFLKEIKENEYGSFVTN